MSLSICQRCRMNTDHEPPEARFLSNTVTSIPAFFKCAAVATPLMPAPITATLLALGTSMISCLPCFHKMSMSTYIYFPVEYEICWSPHSQTKTRTAAGRAITDVLHRLLWWSRCDVLQRWTNHVDSSRDLCRHTCRLLLLSWGQGSTPTIVTCLKDKNHS